MYDKCSDCEYTNYDNYVQEVETQQKEFIKYLEDEIEKQKEDIFENSLTSIKLVKLVKTRKILRKYEEIVNGIERN